MGRVPSESLRVFIFLFIFHDKGKYGANQPNHTCVFQWYNLYVTVSTISHKQAVAVPAHSHHVVGWLAREHTRPSRERITQENSHIHKSSFCDDVKWTGLKSICVNGSSVYGIG